MKSTFTLRALRVSALLSLCLFTGGLAHAGFTPVAVSGYTADVVANGAGTALSSITADVDGAGYAFMAADFNPLGALPTAYLPPSGKVYSVATSGVIFQLEPYTANNSLRLTATNSGTLTFNTAQAASELYLLGVTGSGLGTANITVTFTDATTQTFSSISIPDWYGGSSFAMRGLGRVNTGSNGIDNNPSDPRLYEIKLSLSAANYSKQIASVTVVKATAVGVINIMGVAINTVSGCSTPASQPTALLITPGTTTAAVSFAASIPASDKYLVVRTPLGAALTATPVNTTTYAVSATIGNGTVVSAGNSTSFSDAGLTVGTLYRYTIFAYNDLCTGGPSYNTTSPLTAAASTTSGAIYTNVPATGYTADIVADTAGSASGSISADVDGVAYAFMAQNFNPSGSIFPTAFLPGSGLINSATTPGLSFQLQPYTAFNSLRLTATNSGTLTLNTPLAASDLYLLATSGSGATTASVTVNFTDASTQVFSISVSDWFGGANYAILGVGRVTITTNLIDNNTTNPRLYEIKLSLSAANYGKQIASVLVSKTTTAGVLQVMGLAAIPLPACAAPATQPSGLTLTAGASTVSVAFTAASPAPNKYMIVRTPSGAALTAAPVNGITYAVNGTLGNGTIISIGSSNTFTDAGVIASTQYRYTVFPYNDICSGGPVYNTSGPLTGTVTTNGVTTYTWTGATNFTWTVPTNWSPARYAPDPTDIIQFNNGQTNAVYGVPSQTIRRLVVNNSTTIMLQASSAVTLTLASDNASGTNELDIAAGSTLLSNGHPTTTSSLTIAFSGTGSTANIAGTLESYSLATVAGNNIFNFTNAVVTVAATGTLAEGGTQTATSITGNTAANLIVNGTLNYKYLSTSTPVMPTATWNTGSTTMITGFNTPITAPGGLGQAFYNFIYDCKGQTAINNWAGGGPLNVAGTFTLVSTGTGSLAFSAATGYNYQLANFTQTGGTLNLNTGVATTTPTLNISGTFNQAGGTFTSTGASTGANAPVLNFNGTGGAQNVSFYNAAPVGPITYRISNPAGINLSGTGTLSSGAFNLNTNGGIRVSTTAANPISTALTLTYGATGTTLTYDASAAQTMTANVFPAISGPANLTINTGGSGNIVTMPFSRVVPGTLSMTSGDIDLGANTLTLGSSAAAAGTLTYSSGFIRLSSGGSFTRWYGTTGLPTAAGSGVGFYPIGYNGLSRAVSLFFSAATALSTGGTIGVSHTNATGFTNGLSVADGAYTIDTRINSSWAFAATGATLSGTMGMQLTGAGLYTSSTPANVRVMQAAAVAGTHVPGFASSAVRSGLALTDLTVPYYIGAAAADITGVYIAINSGNWSTGTTWDIGIAPGVANEAYINPGVTVTSNAATNTARLLNILPGGTLNITTGNTVTIDSALQNNGTINVTGGTLTVNGRTSIAGIINNGSSLINMSSGTVNLGPAGGGARPFAENGILTVSGGTLNISGNMSTLAGSVINQSGGNINVDGNAGGVLANSVACALPIVSLVNAANNFTGGTFTVVDPHACTTGANTMVYNNAANITASGTHIFRMGDGVSTDPGGQTPYNFSVNTSLTSTGKLAFNDLVINTGTATNSYFVQGSTTMGVTHDLIVNSGGEFRNSSGQTTYINGNMTVNSGGTFSDLGTVAFANFSTGSVVAGTNAQTVSGSGIFRNAATATPAANFASILINNSGPGVTFNTGYVSYSGTLTFTLGKIFTGSGILAQNAGAGVTGGSQATGWVVGRFQKNATAGGLLHTYPVGDASYYTPLNIAGTTTSAGDIIVGAVAGDHPSISSSLINPTRSVNRYWSIQQVNGLAFNTAGATVTPSWNAADVDAGATTTNFTAASRTSGTWTLQTTASPLPTSIIITVPTTTIDGDYQIGETCSPISITTQPTTQLVCAGSPVSFAVGVAGTAGILYQWQKGGINIPGATSNTYTIPAVTTTDAGSYSVIISSQCGPITSVPSAVAILSVNIPPAVSTQPISQTICERKPVTFTAAATGTGVTYQWQKNGSPITGATGTSYTISSVTVTDAGSYTVLVTGASPCGSVTSSIATLTVNPLPKTITAATTTIFCAGGSVVLNATTGYSYQWLLNNAIIPTATGASYTATVSGNFSVVVSGAGCSDTSNVINVVANSSPLSTISPAGSAVFCSGGSIVLSGPASGGVTYQWNLNGSPIIAATGINYTATVAGNYTLTVAAGTGCSTVSAVTVVTTNPLPTATVTAPGGTAICAGSAITLNANTGTGLTYVWKLNGTPVTPAATGVTYLATAAGTYSVTVTNTATGCQNTSSGIVTTVNSLPTAVISATGSTTFCQGDSVILNANTGAGLSYAWYLNSTAISGATSSSYVVKNAGSYTVVVTSTATNCVQTSSATVVTVNALPNVTVSTSGSLSICAGSTVLLSVPKVAGYTYQWKLNGAGIGSATSDTFSVAAAGNYTVTVTNTSLGCVATSAISTVTVNPAPPATATPVGSTTACQGDTVRINANTGSGLSYQWNVNGGPIGGATSASYAATGTGAYTVTVTNSSNCGVTSSVVNVIMKPSPTSVISYSTPTTFCVGGRVVLNANTNTTGSSYQWRNSGVILPAPTGTNNFYFATTAGSYTVTVTSTNGCSTASTSVPVVVNPLPTPVITRTDSVLSTGTYASYQWYYNGTTINPGGNGQTYTFHKNGNYAVFVTDANGCTNFSPLFYVTNVGVAATGIGGAISVYPNPSHRIVHVDAPVPVNVVIRDLTGRVVLRVVGARQINLQDIADGAYLMMISDEEGNLLKTEKLIKSAQ